MSTVVAKAYRSETDRMRNFSLPMGASFGNCSVVVVPLVLTLHETGYDIMAVTAYVVPSLLSPHPKL